MPNHPIPPQAESHCTLPGYICKSSITATESYQVGYQQALTDFAILNLIDRLQTMSDTNFDASWVTLTTQEAETLAVILIQTLTTNLNGNLLAACLDSLRSSTLNACNSLANLKLPFLSTDLPTAFPNVETPRFLYGDRLRWISNNEATDWGIAIGRFYSFAPHCCCWRWCYLIWLDPDSPSATWVRADLAWEDDLEPLEAEAVL